MELNNIIHTNSRDSLDFEPDLFIAASGYETRATSIPKKFQHLKCKKIAFGFKEHSRDLSRPANDKYFKEHNFSLIIQKSHATPDFTKIFEAFDLERIHVLIDISVMTKDWYHGLLKYLHKFLDFKHFHLRIVYCPALYNEPGRLKKKITIQKFTFLDEFLDRPKEKKKTAMILGLGSEKGISNKVFEQIQPDLSYLMYADPAVEKRYVEDVLVSNHEMINKTPIRYLKGYPLTDTEKIFRILLDIILPLRQAYHIIIVPRGPKIFSLLSMVLQISYPDVELYYPAYKVNQIKDRKPYDRFTTLDLEFDAV